MGEVIPGLPSSCQKHTDRPRARKAGCRSRSAPGAALSNRGWCSPRTDVFGLLDFAPPPVPASGLGRGLAAACPSTRPAPALGLPFAPCPTPAPQLCSRAPSRSFGNPRLATLLLPQASLTPRAARPELVSPAPLTTPALPSVPRAVPQRLQQAGTPLQLPGLGVGSGAVFSIFPNPKSFQFKNLKRDLTVSILGPNPGASVDALPAQSSFCSGSGAGGRRRCQQRYPAGTPAARPARSREPAPWAAWGCF